MRRGVKQGGIVVVRESASLTWYPEPEGINAWRVVGDRMGRAKGGNPHPGRFIHVWAEEAGFPRSNIKKSADSWCFSDQDERKYWGGSMEERARSSGFAVTNPGRVREPRSLREYRDGMEGLYGGRQCLVWTVT